MAKLTKVYCTIELADGRYFDLRIMNQARIASEFYANKKRWAAPELSSMARVSYAIYEQLRIDGVLDDGVSFEDFRKDMLVDFDQREDETEVDPTPLARDDSLLSRSQQRPASAQTGSTPPATKN